MASACCRFLCELKHQAGFHLIQSFFGTVATELDPVAFVVLSLGLNGQR